MHRTPLVSCQPSDRGSHVVVQYGTGVVVYLARSPWGITSFGAGGHAAEGTIAGGSNPGRMGTEGLRPPVHRSTHIPCAQVRWDVSCIYASVCAACCGDWFSLAPPASAAVGPVTSCVHWTVGQIACQDGGWHCFVTQFTSSTPAQECAALGGHMLCH